MAAHLELQRKTRGVTRGCAEQNQRRCAACGRETAEALLETADNYNRNFMVYNIEPSLRRSSIKSIGVAVVLDLFFRSFAAKGGTTLLKDFHCYVTGDDEY